MIGAAGLGARVLAKSATMAVEEAPMALNEVPLAEVNSSADVENSLQGRIAGLDAVKSYQQSSDQSAMTGNDEEAVPDVQLR